MGLFVKTVSGHGSVRVLTSEKLLFFLTMKIFKDVFTGDELFSDTYEIKLIDDVIYEVYGKYETRKEGNIQLEGSNASAEGEDADEGADDPGSQSGIDIVLNHRLQSTGFGAKKEYMDYLKVYMKKVIKFLEDNDRKDEVETFKTNINKNMKTLLGKFKDLEFYLGENMDADGMILILDYKDLNGEERPCFIAFKHGLEEEKV